MTKFHVGQKVVLARDFGYMSMSRATDDGVTIPVRGTIYTIREFDDQRSDGFSLALRLNEIRNAPHYTNGLEPSFCVSLFEPVIERKTDISVFTALLTSQPEQVPA
jgi:hypothetical protein